jgi:hypothetical protein
MLALALSTSPALAQRVQAWVTTADRLQLLRERPVSVREGERVAELTLPPHSLAPLVWTPP